MMIYFDPFEDFEVHNVKGMYMQSLVDELPLLSEYPAGWWTAYRIDHQHYDRLFKKMFASWYPMDQVKDDEISEVTDEFRADVYAWLLANDKRYSEIYRINVIDDTSYDLLNNYDMQETYSGTHTGSGSNVKGQEVIGESNSYVHGAKSRSGSDSTVIGQQQIDTDSTNTFGQHEDISVNSNSAYNESTFTNLDKNDTTYGSQQNIVDETVVMGSHTDTKTTSESETAYTDGETKQRTEGSRTDTNTTSESESHTLHRVGNIGVQTATDMMEKAANFWGLFEFYTFIFKEIARELLRGC